MAGHVLASCLHLFTLYFTFVIGICWSAHTVGPRAFEALEGLTSADTASLPYQVFQGFPFYSCLLLQLNLTSPGPG